MKTRIRIALLIVATMTMTLLFSCSLSPVSIKDRINDFFDSLNGGDRSDTHKNLDPSTSAYSLADAGFWNSQFPKSGEPYSYTSLDTSDSSDVTMTISDNTAPLGVGAWHFVMVDIGSPSENWVINDIQQPPGGSGNSIFP